MAESLWVRTIHHHRIERQATIECGRQDAQNALADACRELDLPKPVWLSKNQREWDEFGQTSFGSDAFFETVPFDKLEIEFIDPDAPKKRSRDPRNDFG